MKTVKLKKLYQNGADVRDYILKKLEDREILKVVYNDEFIEVTKDVLNKNYPKTPIKSIYGEDYNLITIPWRGAKKIDTQLSLL